MIDNIIAGCYTDSTFPNSVTAARYRLVVEIEVQILVGEQEEI